VIAGDTFDYAIDGDVAHIAIFDAVGHGLEAARIANLALSGYRSCRRRGLGLVASYGQVDALLLDQFGPEKFATAQLASFDLTTGRLCWINAGHPPPMVIRDGTPVDLAAPAYLPLGLADMAMDAPTETETVLEPHDRVLFFTDGVTEARSADGTELGRARLAELTCGAAERGEKPAETVRLLGHALLEHRGGALQDDATLLLLVWDGPPGDD
jgi:serine phosphatase RsbU (regulator of sigma subunit)